MAEDQRRCPACRALALSVGDVGGGTSVSPCTGTAGASIARALRRGGGGGLQGGGAGAAMHIEKSMPTSPSADMTTAAAPGRRACTVGAKRLS